MQLELDIRKQLRYLYVQYDYAKSIGEVDMIDYLGQQIRELESQLDCIIEENIITERF